MAIISDGTARVLINNSSGAVTFGAIDSTNKLYWLY